MTAVNAFAARHGALLVAVVTISMYGSVAAQTPVDTTVTQSGISTATDDGQGNYPPVHVSFAKEFGGVPKVTATYGVSSHYGGKIHVNPASLTATNITRTGFDWQFPQSGNRSGWHWPANLKWTATGPDLQIGTVVPNYMVLTVIYAPPGTGGGHSTSSVTYQSASTAGTLTSSSASFKSGVSVSIEASGGILGSGGGAGVSWDKSITTTDGQSLEIKKSTTTTLAQTGPSSDGVNHDEDEIYLLLKPTIRVGLSMSVAEWMLTDTPATIQYVHVGWLNGHQPMPAGVLSALQAAGITPAAYPDILARDPLASGGTLSAPRYVAINTSFPYEPPYSANDPVPTFTYNITNAKTATATTSTEDTLKVDANVSGSGSFLGFASFKLKDSASWEWTNKSSDSASVGTSESAQLTIGGPAYGFIGPSVIQVYYDTIYRTFAFALVAASSSPAALTGTVLTQDGKPAANTPVTLIESSGESHLTYSNQHGAFRFSEDIAPGPAIVKAPGVAKALPNVGAGNAVMLQQPR